VLEGAYIAFAMMIYNSCGIDDMQGLRLDDMQNFVLIASLARSKGQRSKNSTSKDVQSFFGHRNQ
jgi:hypothetical protein